MTFEKAVKVMNRLDAIGIIHSGIPMFDIPDAVLLIALMKGAVEGTPIDVSSFEPLADLPEEVFIRWLPEMREIVKNFNLYVNNENEDVNTESKRMGIIGVI